MARAHPQLFWLRRGVWPCLAYRMDALLARHSQSSIWRVRQHVLKKKPEPKAHQRSGAFKRRLQLETAPYVLAYRPVSAAAIEGREDVQFAVADVRSMLRLVAAASPLLTQLLAAHHERELRVVLCQDEATAGNVLQTEQRQKISFYYIALAELGEYLQSPHFWLPLASLSH